MNAVAILRRTLPGDEAARLELKEIADRIESLASSADRRRAGPPVPIREIPIPRR